MAQIAAKLNQSLSVVRYELTKNKIPRRSRSEAINNWYRDKHNKKPFKLRATLSNADQKLKTAGVMLYWGEGGKSGNVVKFTNSDPDMIKIFLQFLRQICGIDENRLKALVHIYPDHKEKDLILFWAKKTGIPQEHFYKSYLHEGKKGTYKNKAIWGTITVNYPDKRLLDVILGWISKYRT